MKLKQAMTRSSKSSLTLIATTMEATPWWNELIHNYLQELPGVQEWLPKVQTDMLKWDGMDFTLEKLAEMQEVVKNLHVYTTALKPKRVTQLMDKTIDSVTKLSNQALHNSDRDTNALEKTKKCYSILHELTIVMPKDDGLQALKMALDTHVKLLCTVDDIQKMAQCADEFNKLQKPIDDDDIGDQNKLQASIVDMYKCMSSLATDVDGISKDMLLVLQSAWVNLANLLAKIYFVVEPLWEVKFLEEGTFILGKLLSVCDLGNVEFKLFFDAFQLVVDLNKKLSELQPTQDMSLESGEKPRCRFKAESFDESFDEVC
eukprot:3827-Amphidinium_carterae.1